MSDHQEILSALQSQAAAHQASANLLQELATKNHNSLTPDERLALSFGAYLMTEKVNDALRRAAELASVFGLQPATSTVTINAPEGVQAEVRESIDSAGGKVIEIHSKVPA